MKPITFLSFLVCFSFLTVQNIMAAATLTTLHIFTGTDGSAPEAALVLGANGNLYGTTWAGGTNKNCIGGCGTIFEITPDGAFTSLHSFTNYDGSAPRGGLIQASDGNFYGTTSAGGFFGPGGLGSIFRMTPDGTFTMIHSFDTGGGGIGPEGELIQGKDGFLYGIASSGPVPGGGIGGVFRISTNGDFTSIKGLNQPAAGVIQADDGNLYGTTEFGGNSTNCPSGCGSVYRMTLDGTVTTLHSFDGTDGKNPQSALVQGPDGKLYGTTSGGGLAQGGCANGCGTIFQITTDGAFTNLHSFSGTDGRQPRTGLTLGRDRNLYGTAFSGGGSSFGSIFQITTNGVFTKLVGFAASNGGGPEGTLIEGKEDGVFYGTTEVGGSTNGLGTVYKLTISTNATGSLVVLTPSLDTNSVGSSYTVIATVTSNGIPRNGASISFSIISGPNAGKTQSAFVIAGQASFTYAGTNGPGIDIIRAASIGTSATATNIWIAPDSVSDGIPASWRAQYFGGDGTTTNNQSCALCDADNSGQNNYFKYIAGLNPTNAASIFTFTLQNTSGQKNLTYKPLVTGHSYHLQFRTNLVQGSWEDLTAYTGATNADQVTLTDLTAANAPRFYRIAISFP